MSDALFDMNFLSEEEKQEVQAIFQDYRASDREGI